MIRRLLVGVILGALVSLAVVTPAHAAPAPLGPSNFFEDAKKNAVYVTSELLVGTYGATQGDSAEEFNSNAARGRRGAQGASSHNGKSGARSIPLGIASKMGKGAEAADLVKSTYRLGTGAANFGLKWFGIDNRSTVCSNTSDEYMDVWSEMARTLSGQDCDMFQTADGYVPNADVPKAKVAGLLNDTYAVSNEWWRGTMTVENPIVGRGGAVTMTRTRSTPDTTLPSPSGLSVLCKADDPSVPLASRYQLRPVGNSEAALWNEPDVDVKNWPISCSVGFSVVMFGNISTRTSEASAATYGCKIWEHFYGTQGCNSTHKYPLYVTQLSKHWEAGEEGSTKRTYECSTTYTDGTTVSGVSKEFDEADGSLGRPLCPAPPKVPGAAPKVVDKVVVTDSVTKQPVHSQTSSPAYKSAATTDPECMDGSCVLNLKVKATGKSCFDLKDVCRDWIDNKADYSCEYGTKAKPIESCFVYGNTFDRAKVAVGNPYADPATGEDTHSVTGPSLDGEGMARSVRPNEQGRDCFGDGWATVANPLDWVMVPVNCSLEWAFVPNEIVLQEAAFNTADAWGETAPGKMASFVGGLAAVAPHLDGCEGPRVHFTIDFRGFAPWAFLEVDSYPMSACAPPWDFVAGAARVIGGLFMCYAAFRASSRYLGGIIGFAEFGKGA